jgi:hypothetical protein
LLKHLRLLLCQHLRPSIPEFTVQFVDNSYNVPATATSTTNPYTGKTTTTTTPAYHVENQTIEITIKNQPYTPYTNEYGVEALFYYNVRTKGHYEENWTDLYNSEDGYAPQSNSTYTILSISANNYPSGGQVDFQVQAMIGAVHPSFNGTPSIFTRIYPFVGQTSAWSSTQTVTIPETASSPSATPISTPTVPEFPTWILLPLFVVIILMSTVLIRKKNPRKVHFSFAREE